MIKKDKKNFLWDLKIGQLRNLFNGLNQFAYNLIFNQKNSKTIMKIRIINNLKKMKNKINMNMNMNIIKNKMNLIKVKMEKKKKMRIVLLIMKLQ